MIHTFPVRVYYEDTDFSGAVYHASYLRFMERGRTEFLRALGMDQASAFASDGLGFGVRAMAIDFLKPARMDDVLAVETRVTEVAGASLAMQQRVLRGTEVLVTATVKVAAIRAARAARLPANLRAKIAATLANSP